MTQLTLICGVPQRLSAWAYSIFAVCATDRWHNSQNKSKYMIFHMHKKDIPSFSLKLGNTNIEKVDDFNYLGLTLDTDLNWKKHTGKVANRC